MSEQPEAPCSGMTFEHRDRLEFAEDRPGTWRCPACGTEGDGAGDVASRLYLLAAMARQVHNTTGYSPVILLPSDRPPMFVGHFAGVEIFRVQGISGPMAAVRQPVPVTDGGEGGAG